MSRRRSEQQKAPTNLSSPPVKTKPLLLLCMRVGLTLSLLASILLALSATFPNRTHQTLIGVTSSVIEAPTNVSHLLFGLGSSADTWRSRSNLTSAWWNSNTTRGYVWLDTKPNESLLSLEDSTRVPYKVSENWERLRYSHSPGEARIARVVVDSFNLKLPDVRWFVMGDDDTVFFPENLAAVLSRYDHNEMYYVGGNSESVDQNEMHAYDMAFGGGGFAVSYPLAARLAKQMDGCLERYFNMYGSDQRVWACMIEIGVPLTKLSGFHQVYRVDPPRILQQSFCYDRRRRWTLSVSWGFTIQLYPFLVSANELQTPLRTFKTWRKWENGPFTFSTRAVSSDPWMGKFGIL